MVLFQIWYITTTNLSMFLLSIVFLNNVISNNSNDQLKMYVCHRNNPVSLSTALLWPLITCLTTTILSLLSLTVPVLPRCFPESFCNHLWQMPALETGGKEYDGHWSTRFQWHHLNNFRTIPLGWVGISRANGEAKEFIKSTNPRADRTRINCMGLNELFKKVITNCIAFLFETTLSL